MFEQAFNCLFMSQLKTFELCHGATRLGIPHAWVESKEMGVVIENKNGLNVMCSIETYYKRHELDPDVIRRWSLIQAVRRSLIDGNFGPWW